MTNTELIDAIVSKVENRAKINDELEMREPNKIYHAGFGDALSFVLLDIKKIKESLI